MSKLAERIFVKCPFGMASSYMEWYLDTLGEADKNGKTALKLKVPLDDIDLPGNLMLSRDVIAEFAPVDDSAARQQSTTIYWEPKGGGPFPKFVGVLTVQSDEINGASWLQLEGSYDPPFGVLGAVFDAAVGKRIAHATATALLYELRTGLEKTRREAKNQ